MTQRNAPTLPPPADLHAMLVDRARALLNMSAQLKAESEALMKAAAALESK